MARKCNLTKEMVDAIFDPEETEINIQGMIHCDDETIEISGIDPKVFYGNVHLKKVHISRGCTFVSDYAFANCRNLEEVIIDRGCVHIGEHAFHNCTSLKLIDVSETACFIHESAFEACTSLTTIKNIEHVKYIDTLAFLNCSELKELPILTANVIESKAFFMCPKLNEIRVSTASAVSIGKKLFDFNDFSIAFVHGNVEYVIIRKSEN